MHPQSECKVHGAASRRPLVLRASATMVDHGNAEYLSYLRHEEKRPDDDPEVLAVEAELALEQNMYDAIEHREVDAVRYLLEVGIDPGLIYSFAGKRLISHACEKGHLGTVKLLREYGAPLTVRYENEPHLKEVYEHVNFYVQHRGGSFLEVDEEVPPNQPSSRLLGDALGITVYFGGITRPPFAAEVREYLQSDPPPGNKSTFYAAPPAGRPFARDAHKW